MKAWLIGACAVLLTAAGCGDDLPNAGGTDTDTGSGTGTGDDTSGGEVDDTGTDTGTDTDDEFDPSSVPEPKAGRLNDLQYGYTVNDVLGIRLTDDEQDALPTDIPSGRDYSTTIDLQFFNANYVLAYAEIARSVSARLDPVELVARFGGCGELSEDCRPTFIEALGHRMFRRPLTEDEQARFLDLAMAIAEPEQTDETHVVRGIVQAMMQSSEFLYRMERETDGEPGAVRSIDGWELASRLSYFLWQSAPDEPLLEFAAGPAGDGEYDPAQLGDQIDRMLADGKFARTRSLFWGDYTLASRSSFATPDEQLAAEFRDSLLATLERISNGEDGSGSLSALFDGQQLVMTPAVAQIAGATPVGEGLEVYDVADAEQRLGVVTHPAMLASIGTTSFVGRGLFLTERLLCQYVAEPPEEVAEEIENTAQATEDMTPREASEFRLGLEPVCQGCHLQFEPIAYAFERYDMTGGYTLTDDQGRELYSDGVLPEYRDRPQIEFSDAPELLTQLTDTDVVYACMVENMTTFGTGQRANLTGDFHDVATTSFIGQGQTFDALVRSVAQSEQRTLMRVVEP